MPDLGASGYETTSVQLRDAAERSEAIPTRRVSEGAAVSRPEEDVFESFHAGC